MSHLRALLPLALCAGLASAQNARGSDVLRAPFERLADSGAQGVVRLAFDARDHAEFSERHARGTGFTLAGLPLPGGRALELFLRPVGVFEPGARAQVVGADGSVSFVAPQVVCFSGSVRGGGEVFLGLSPEQLHGYVRVGSDLYFLSSGEGRPGEATLAHASRTSSASAAGSAFCALVGSKLGQDDGLQQALAAGIKLASVFIEADRAYRQLFASDQACIDYTTLLITATSEVYRRDVGARLVIPNGYLRVWNTTAPWGVITTFNDINDVQAYWTSLANPNRNLARAAVHVLTTPVFGGVAWNIGGICNNSQGYEVSSVFGHFPYPIDHTNNDNWDLFVVAHEFGHSFGCVHAFDFAPPITCQDGSGPDSGTIMSYCHLDFGTGAVGMRFHLREQQRIRGYMATVGCLTSIALQSGDYDGDGLRTVDDLAVADAVLAQGFRSLGAEETLDMDADGDFDVIDRNILGSLVGVPPASVTIRNGTGVNPECLVSFTNPVLGTTWEPAVLAFGPGHPTVLWIHDQGHTGLPTPYGQYLLKPTGAGGVQLLKHIALSDGLFATHSLPIPVDLGLAGLSASAQGIIVGPPGGTALCNALDIVLSTYE